MQQFPKDMYLYFAMLYFIHVYLICYLRVAWDFAKSSYVLFCSIIIT